MIKRNGPYGYPTWKQIRTSRKPFVSKQRKENIFTMVEEPGPEVTFNRDGKSQPFEESMDQFLNTTKSPSHLGINHSSLSVK